MEAKNWICDVHVSSTDGVSVLWDLDAGEATVRLATLALDYEAAVSQIREFLEAKDVRVLWFDEAREVLDYFKIHGYSRDLAIACKKLTHKKPTNIVQLSPIANVEIDEDQPSFDVERVELKDIRAVTEAPLWALIDGVNAQDFVLNLIGKDFAASLYTSPDHNIRDIGPWIVNLEGQDTIIDTLMGYPHDKHWGFFFTSGDKLNELRNHFRKFTMIWTPNNSEMKEFFRFYDPRVYLDISVALEEQKFLSLNRFVEQVFLPISPSMYFEEDESFEFLNSVEEFQGRYLQYSFNHEYLPQDLAGRSFRIGLKEYQTLGTRHFSKGKISIARWLFENYADVYPRAQIARAAFEGADRAILYGLNSDRCARVFCKCSLIFSPIFETDPIVRKILENKELHQIQKLIKLSNWFEAQDNSPSETKLAKMV